MKKYIAIASVAVIGLSLSACGSFTKFSEAVSTCGGQSDGVLVEDGGNTLLIDMMGDDDYSGADVSKVLCLIDAVGTPSYIVSQIENTTAMSGRQLASFDGIDVSWSYIPSNGLDITYHKN